MMEKEGMQRKPSAVWGALKSVKTKLSLTPEGATPINWKIVFLVFISLFSSSYNITFIFPFLPEMILSFGYKEAEKGYYAGIVASALFIGRAFSSYFWGALSDRIGRRPVILLTVLLNGISSLAFGFTTDIYFGFITRLISGLVNGTVGSVKTVLYEVTDNTNQAVGMSVISMAWGLGMITGPAIGGYLANPCKRYPSVFPSEGFFYQFPYIFPGLCAFVFCIIAFICDFILLPETLNMKNVEVSVPVTDGEAEDKISLRSDPRLSPLLHRLSSMESQAAPSVENLHLECEGATYLAGSRTEMHITRKGITFSKIPDDDDDDNNGCSNNSEAADKSAKFSVDDVSDKPNGVNGTSMKVSEKPQVDVAHCDDTGGSETLLPSHQKMTTETNKHTGCRRWIHAVANWRPIMLLRQFDVCLAVGLYSFSSFAVIGIEEIFTVWAATDLVYDGLQMAPNEIGTVLGATSLPLVFIQMFLFPHLIRRLEIKKTMIICCMILTILAQTLPSYHLLVNQPSVLWPLMLCHYTLIKLLISCVFSCTGLLINNSVTPDIAGSVNGLAMTLTASTRAMAPLFGGVIYSWTISYASDNIGPPFDVSFIFFIYGFVFWLCGVIGVTIPERLNKQKKENQ